MPNVMLTTDFIKTELVCPEDKTKIEYCDLQVRGLYVGVLRTSQGRGVYTYRWKHPERKVTVHSKIARTDEISLADARKRALALKADIFRGSDPQALLRDQKSVPTFQVFADEHYLPFAKAHKRSWKNDKAILRLRLLPAFGDMKLNAITRRQVQEYHTGLQRTDLSPASMDHDLRLLKRMLNVAIQFEFLTQNVAIGVKPYAPDNRRTRHLDDQEFARLLAVLRSHSNRTVAQIIMLIVSTGVRASEAIGAEWSQFDLKNRVWRIPASRAKAKRIRTLPLNDAAMDVLEGILRRTDQPYLWRSSQTGDQMKYIAKVWGRIRVEAGLPDVRLHDLRRSFACVAINAGASLQEVSKLLGHSSSSVTENHYAYLSAKSLQTATDRVSKAIEEIASPNNPEPAPEPKRTNGPDTAEVIPIKPRAA
jgi:integrase